MSDEGTETEVPLEEELLLAVVTLLDELDVEALEKDEELELEMEDDEEEEEDEEKELEDVPGADVEVVVD